jgi:dCMP deaminase
LVHERPSWDEYFMGIAREVAKRATCDRGRNGAVIVKDKRILTTGYVGAPTKLPHCDDVGHLMKTVQNDDGTTSQHCIRTTHAEQNAIVQAARHGISIKDSTLYCRMEPCIDCAKMIINAGIKRIVAEKKYHRGQLAREMLRDAGIKVEILKDEVVEYDKQ